MCRYGVNPRRMHCARHGRAITRVEILYDCARNVEIYGVWSWSYNIIIIEWAMLYLHSIKAIDAERNEAYSMNDQ